MAKNLRKHLFLPVDLALGKIVEEDSTISRQSRLSSAGIEVPY